MSFIETDEQKELRKAVAQFSASYGEKYYLEKARAGEHTTELWEEAGKLGFIGVNLPEEYGGGGAGMYELSLVMEEMSAGGCALLLMVVSPRSTGPSSASSAPRSRSSAGSRASPTDRSRWPSPSPSRRRVELAPDHHDRTARR